MVDSVLLRMRGRTGREQATGVSVGAGLGWSMTIGDDGTTGRTEIDIDTGRFRPFGFGVGTGGRSNDDRIAVAGGGGSTWNDVFHAGADGGSRAVWEARLFAVKGGISLESSASSSGELDAEDSSVFPSLRGLSESKPPPTPRSASSSSSSTKSSLITLLDELAIEPVRLRLAYRLRQAGPIPIPDFPEAVDANEDVELFRATIRSSMALSSARASCIMAELSRSSSDSLLSSISCRRRTHSSSLEASSSDSSEVEPDRNVFS